MAAFFGQDVLQCQKTLKIYILFINKKDALDHRASFLLPHSREND